MRRSYSHRRRRKVNKDSSNIFTLDESMLTKYLQDFSLFYSGSWLFYSRCEHIIQQKYGETELLPTSQNTAIIPLSKTCLSNAKIENKLPDYAESLGMPTRVRTFFRLLPGRLILLTALLVPAIDSNIVKILRSCIGLQDSSHNEAINRLVSLQREQLLESVGKQQHTLTREGAQALINFLVSYKDMLSAFNLPVPESDREPEYLAKAIGNIYMARVHPARKKASSPHRLAISTVYIHTLMYPRPADSGGFFVYPESPLKWNMSADAIGNRILDIDFKMFSPRPGRRASLEIDCGTEQITRAAKGTSLLDKISDYVSFYDSYNDHTLRDIIFLVTATKSAPKKVTKAEKGIAIGNNAVCISSAKYRHLLDLQIFLTAIAQYFDMFAEDIDMYMLKDFFKSFQKTEGHKLSYAMQSNVNLLIDSLAASEQDNINDLSGWLEWMQQLGNSSSEEPVNLASDLHGLSKNSRAANILAAIFACPPNSPIGRAVRTGTQIAAVPYKSWDMLHILEPEQWFGFSSIWRALVFLFIISSDNNYLSPKNTWSLKYNHALLRDSKNSYNDSKYDYYVRLALLSDTTTIAIENISHDAGGLIRARDIISSMPANLGRNVLLVLLCADDYILADGTSAFQGGLCIDNARRLINYPDCENQRGGIRQEYAYYHRTVGWDFTDEKFDNFTPKPDPGHKYHALPYLTGIACDFVLVTYSQFLHAVNSMLSYGLTILSDNTIYLRFARTIANPVKPYRRLEDRSWFDNV